MRELRCGDASVLGVLFDRYCRIVFDIARRILRDPGEAEDLMQEVFLEVYRKADLYDSDKGSFRTWLLQYAYHRSFNRRKYLALRSFYDVSPAAALADAELSSEWDVREGLTSHEWQQVLQRAVRELNGKERRIIESVAFKGQTVREASEEMKESYVNGRNHYYRGLKKLRDFLRNGSQRQVGDNVRT
jgi:RNA polymerase sigma-70 factor (ECF subfamily)